MQIKVSKVFANFINKVAKENSVKFNAKVVTIPEKYARYYIGSNVDYYNDFDFANLAYKVIKIEYPPEYYANPIYLTTVQLNQDFNRYNVKTVDDLKLMILDICEI